MHPLLSLVIFADSTRVKLEGLDHRHSAQLANGTLAVFKKVQSRVARVDLRASASGKPRPRLALLSLVLGRRSSALAMALVFFAWQCQC